MNSKPEREISKNVLEFDVNTEYKTDLITGMNFSADVCSKEKRTIRKKRRTIIQYKWKSPLFLRIRIFDDYLLPHCHFVQKMSLKSLLRKERDLFS